MPPPYVNNQLDQTMRDERKRSKARRSEGTAAGSKTFSLWNERFALVLILALAAFLRLSRFTAAPPPLHFDEAMNGNDAMENLETGHISVFYPQNGGREGLYINLETGLIALFGNEAWVLRLPAAIFGILTVWGVYYLAAELFSPQVGLFASFFLATSLWHLIFSRIGLRVIGAPLLLVWALYLLIKGLRRARDGQGFLWNLIAAGLLYGAGFYTYIAYRASPPLIAFVLAWYFVAARRERKLARFRQCCVMFAGAALAAVVPLIAYFFRHPEWVMRRTGEVSIFNDPNPFSELTVNIWKTIQMIFTKGDVDWLHNISGRPEVFWPVAILFALGAALGGVAVSGAPGSVLRTQWRWDG
jgi:4-amino-4-deoxy-L-arabinose transferase-like glycosyltransferase